MNIWNFKKSSKGSGLMMSKTDVIEEVSNLEVIHGGAKFIDANHNQLWHISIDSFSRYLLFTNVCSTRSGR